MTFKEKIMLAQKNNIFIPFDLANNQNIVGVYKIFGEKNERRTCLYIGKSTNIAYRLLGSGGGHIYMYLNNNLSKLVPYCPALNGSFPLVFFLTSPNHFLIRTNRNLCRFYLILFRPLLCQ